MDINKRIEEIVNRRALHLPKIEDELTRLNEIAEAVTKLDDLRSEIKDELEAGRGTYYSILMENPKMKLAYDKLSTEHVWPLLAKQKELLENLKKRFDRKTLSIAMIGYERQGKSQFLQSITGLNNKVIPAYTGTSCTGAVSVIHNIDGPFRTEVTYYSMDEFLEIVNDKIAGFFPMRSIRITNLAQLKTVDLSGFTSTNKDKIGEYNKFMDSFVGHVDDYAFLLDRGTVTYDDEDEIALHVAQYENFDTPVEGSVLVPTNSGEKVYRRYYHRYIAVKNVHIFKQFEMIDSKLIELVDTIGIGDNSNAVKIKEEMFRVLQEECDAAVDVFKPDSMGGGFNSDQSAVLKEIADRLQDREPDKWIAYVINKVSSFPGMNIENLESSLQEAQKFVDHMVTRPVAWTKIIDGANSAEVFSELIVPLLELIAKNLPDLDRMLMEKANANGQVLRAEYYNLVNGVGKVLSGSVARRANEGKLFDTLISELPLPAALRALDEDKYRPLGQKPCREIETAIEAIIQNLNKDIPKKDGIVAAINEGVKSPSQIYEAGCDEMLTNIMKRFDSVSDNVITPMREAVKADLTKCLFDVGLLGRIPLRNYVVADGPSLAWLRCLVDEKVKEADYPNLRRALLYLINYDFTIKYTIEYDVSKSLGIIDKLNLEEFRAMTPIKDGTVEQRAIGIIQQLVNKVPKLKIKLGERNDRFALVPSHAFMTMVSKFRTELVRNETTSRELRDFYRDNLWSIWQEEFSMIEDKADAFGRWNEIADKLSTLYSSAGFVIS